MTAEEAFGALFRRYCAAQAVSGLGSALSRFALPVLVYQMTGSPVQLAVIGVTQYLPYLLFGLVIGAWVDRVDRRRLMLAADILRALVMLSLALLWYAGALTLWWLYGAAFLVAAIGIAFNAAEFAGLPAMVPKPALPRAYARLQAVSALMQMAGPAAAGALQGSVPLALLFLFDAASYLCSAAGIAGLPAAQRQARPSAGLGGDIAAGWRHVAGDPLLRDVSLLLAALNFLTATASAQLVLFGKQALGTSDTQLGWLFAAGGAGAVVFALAAERCLRRVPPGRVILATVALQGVVLLLFAANTNTGMALLLWGLDQGLVMLCAIAARVLRQATVPAALLGRVVTVAEVLAWSVIPLGSMLGAALLQRVARPEPLYQGMGVAVLLLALLFWGSPLGHKPLPKQFLKQESI